MARRRDIDRLTELEELFADLWQVPRFAAGMRHAYRPQIDVFRGEDPPEVTVVVELPGADPDAIRLQLEDGRLLLSGARPRPGGGGQVWYRSEIEYGPFSREVALPLDVDVDRASATYDRGLLRIVLPLADRPPPRARIAIEVRRIA
jgi:HSP20 family protein